MRLFLVFFLIVGPRVFSQEPTFEHPLPREHEADPKLPNGKSQNDEILKAEYQKSLSDAAELVELSQSLQEDLKKETRHVLSISSLKKTEEIEKIAKRIRSRIRRS